MKNTTRGFANLMGIMIITVIGISACIALLSIDTTSVDQSITEEAFAQARNNADTCVESELLALRNDDTHSGANTDAFDRGTCTGETTNTLLGDGTRTISISSVGSVDNVRLHEEASFTITYPPPDALPTFSRVIIAEVP